MICTLLLAGTSLANDGPSPKLHAEASGQTVTLKLELHGAGEPGLGEDLVIVRSEPTPETIVVETTAYEASGADYETEYCKNWEIDSTWWGDDTGEYWSCNDYPDRCEDCDGDGVNECQHGCVTWQGFTLPLDCVEPGNITYEVREDGWDYPADEVSLEVEDEGRDCGSASGDEPPSGGDEEAEADAGGLLSCATTPAPRAGQLLLGLLMGLAGWFSLRRDRNR